MWKKFLASFACFSMVCGSLFAYWGSPTVKTPSVTAEPIQASSESSETSEATAQENSGEQSAETDAILTDMEETIASLKKGQKLDEQTLNDLKATAEDSAKTQSELEEALDELTRWHLGIGAGAIYLNENAGAEIGFTLRKQHFMIFTGVSWYPIDDDADADHLGVNAGIVWEF